AAFGTTGADFVGLDDLDQTAFGDEGPRSRWLPAVATVVVLGLVGGGIIAAAPWDDGSTATPVDTTVPPTTTTVRPTATTQPVTVFTVDPATIGPPGFVFDDPGSLQIVGAWSAGEGARPATAYADDRFDLWTTPGATRTTGKWMAVVTQHSRDDYEEMWPEAVRVQVGSGAGLVASSDEGVSRMLFTASDETPFQIAAFGFSLADLMAMAGEVHDGADDNTIYYGTMIDSVLAGLSPRVSQLVPYGTVDANGLVAQPDTSTSYSGNNGNMWVSVAVSSPTDLDAAVYEFLMRPVTITDAEDQAALDALARNGQPVRLTENPASPGNIVATRMTERGAITVSSYNVALSTVIRLLSQVRLTGQAEWADLIDRTNRGEFNNESSSTGVPATQIGVQQDGRNPFWIAQMLPGDPVNVYVSVGNSGWGGQLSDVGAAPTVHQFASASYTFLVGTARSPSTARVMRVTVQGQAPIDTPMVQVGDTPLYAAAYAFSDALPDTVEFLDSAGNVVTE
ncbi:MAG: hypothetical protein JWN99_3375, partial [Ilumatobacteraceae bacterium]|nr:hypothetical protein [Ilumatobacteraceae bacterium]